MKPKSQVNQTKSWFFAKSNKIEKPLGQTDEEKREKTSITSLRNVNRDITTDPSHGP